MRSWFSLITMVSFKPLLGYVLRPVGVEICRELCCQVTGKSVCVFLPKALLCQVTQRNQLQAADNWIILDVSRMHRAIYEAKMTECAEHSRLHRSRTKGVKCIAVSSEPKCILGDQSDHGRCTCVNGKPRRTFQEEITEKRPPVKGKSSVWTEGDIWIGMRDLCDNNKFLWLDGQVPTFSNWASEDEKRFKEGEKCVKMQFTFPGANWLSASCNSSYRYICQLILPDKTTLPN